jgi:hypothetical protein
MLRWGTRWGWCHEQNIGEKWIHNPKKVFHFFSSTESLHSLVSIFRCPRPPLNPVYPRSLVCSFLAFSLSLHRRPCICIVFRFRFTYYNKHTKNPFPILLLHGNCEKRRAVDVITRHPCIFRQTCLSFTTTQTVLLEKSLGKGDLNTKKGKQKVADVLTKETGQKFCLL